jgi:hypothetical protein
MAGQPLTQSDVAARFARLPLLILSINSDTTKVVSFK